MRNSALILVSCASFALVWGCKAKENSSESEATPPATTEPAPEPPKPEPVVPDAQGPAVLSTSATVLLSDEATAVAQWTHADTKILLRAEFDPDAGAETRSASIYAQVGDAEDTKVFACKNLPKDSGPRVEAMQRGEHVHLLCITPPAGDAAGFTDGLRVSLNPSTGALKETGSYGGEGIVDPDTIDLDEGGME